MAASLIIRSNQLVALYVALVILEGALRKWVVPGSLNSLVAIARDPIALLLIWQGFRRGLFQRDWLLNAWLGLAFVLAAAGLLSLFDTSQPLLIWLFGLRTACLHFPLILIIPHLLTPADLEKLLNRLLWLAAPIALIMVWQYRSPPDAWINRVALDGGSLLTAVAGLVRPPGPFSFINGAAEYFSLVTAIVVGRWFSGQRDIRLLLYGTASILLAATVSGSRLLFSYVYLVALGTLAVRTLRLFRLPSLRTVVLPALASFIAALAIPFTPLAAVVGKAWKTTSARFREANDSDGGVITRGLQTFNVPQGVLDQTPFWGHGLGLGTNFGAKALSGKVGFTLAENEWPRLIQESGLLAGSLFILFRLILAGHVGRQAWQALRYEDSLSLALFFSNLMVLINSNIARPTSMGFVVLSMAFSLSNSRFTLLSHAASSSSPEPDLP